MFGQHPFPLQIFPAPSLRIYGREVEQFDEPGTQGPLWKLVTTMGNVMSANNGIGLSAPQVGVASRVFILNREPTKKEKARHGDAARAAVAFVNPRITWSSDVLNEADEGCLSLPGLHVTIERPISVEIEAYDVYGGFFRAKLIGQDARTAQHESDHLDGKLIVDYLDRESYRLAVVGLAEIIEKHANVGPSVVAA